jgi:hypothetical protein
MGILQDAADAFRAHSSEARQAFGIYRSYCGGNVPPRVPGMDTYDRLAYRISLGRTIEEAAAREYLYRWSLAIKAPDQCGATGRKSYESRDRNPRACVSVFGTPHTIGL